MCFSAEASFAAGAALLPAGAYCIRSAVRKDTRFLALASVPLLFGVQQLCEGLVWVGLEGGNERLARGAAFFFLFFALPFWPFWVPLCGLFTEARTRPRRVLWAGALLGSVLGWAIFAPTLLDSDGWLRVGVKHHSLQYDLVVLPVFHAVRPELWTLFYLTVVLSPLVVCSNPRFRFFVATLAVAAAISYLFFYYAYESVWCFFAAALSLQLCDAFYRLPAAGQGSANPSAAPMRPEAIAAQERGA